MVGDICTIYTNTKEYHSKNISENNIRDVCSRYSIKKLIEYSLDKKKVTNRLKELQYEHDHIDQFGYKRVQTLI